MRAELSFHGEFEPGFSLIGWLENVQDRRPLPSAPYESRILPFRWRRDPRRAVTIFEWEDPVE